MSPILFFIFFFTCIGVGKIFLQINSAAVAFIDILIAAWEGLKCTIASLSYNDGNIIQCLCDFLCEVLNDEELSKGTV